MPTSNPNSFAGSSGSSVMQDRRQQQQQQPGFLSARRGGARGGRAARGGASRVSVVMCNCEEEAVRRTVQKAGPNKGKEFYVCSKPREQQCQFFEWADDVPAASVRQFSSRGGRGRGRGGGNSWRGTNREDSEGNRTRAPPTCSVCHMQGHNKRSCPQLR